jgi:hypothetical protein
MMQKKYSNVEEYVGDGNSIKKIKPLPSGTFFFSTRKKRQINWDRIST